MCPFLKLSDERATCELFKLPQTEQNGLPIWICASDAERQCKIYRLSTQPVDPPLYQFSIPARSHSLGYRVRHINRLGGFRSVIHDMI